MRLTYGQIFRLFVRLLDVHDRKSTALTGRLKHFQRAGFPTRSRYDTTPTNGYGADEVFALAFAFRLLRLRYTPADAAAAVDANWDLLRRMVAQAWRRSDGGPAAEPGPLLIRVVADGLEDLRRDGFERGPPDRVERITQEEVWKWMRGIDPIPPNGLIILDVDEIVLETLDALLQLNICTPLQLEKGRYLLESSVSAAAPAAVVWAH